MTQIMNNICTICKSPLNLPGRIWTQSCGGDCLACIKETGDPDCNFKVIPANVLIDCTVSRTGKMIILDFTDETYDCRSLDLMFDILTGNKE